MSLKSQIVTNCKLILNVNKLNTLINEIYLINNCAALY